ncbi:MAG: SDR family NAD(P)-dependent oxidoreductase [Pseudomonadota bacterium]
MSSDALKGRIILITGASRGIGYAAGVACAKRGATVIGLARTVSGLEKLDDEIRSVGGQTTLIPVDITQEEAIGRLPAVLDERFGRLDGVILNAGILGPLTAVSEVLGKEWHETFTMNLHVNLAMLQLLHPLLQKSESGRVAAVTSRAGRVFKPFWGPYAASKAALDALIKTYAAEQETGAIRANLLDPGPTATAMRELAMPGEDQSKLTPPEIIGECLADMVEASYTDNGEMVVVPRADGT